MPLQATSGAASYDAFGGGVPSEPNYIESVFQTYLYTGTGATQPITNGIDLSTKGGLVWFKSRSLAENHLLVDTIRGNTKYLKTNSTAAQTTDTAVTFNSNGITLPSDIAGLNGVSETFASWTFRKQPKFFDVVTYTGNGVAGRTVAHNLGSAPGCVIVKKISATGNWAVYHRSTTATKRLLLNDTAAESVDSAYWNDTEPTDSVFTVGTQQNVNTSGATYVAYLFAHNAGGFGLTGTDNVISCGSFTLDSVNKISVTLGYEPQWLLFKKTNGAEGWFLFDTMRGFNYSQTNYLEPNTSNSETSFSDNPSPTSTGFVINSASIGSGNYIYIAIRRGPMKVPTDGTSVFSPTAYTATNVNNRLVNTGIVTDMTMARNRIGLRGFYTADRLRGDGFLQTAATDAEATDADSFMTPTSGVGNSFSAMNGFGVGADITRRLNYSTLEEIAYAFRRAPSFFDEVCYTGNATAGRTINHNLGVVPELMIVKDRSNVTNWGVWNKDIFAANPANILILQLSNAATSGGGTYFNSTAPTSTVFTVGDASATNGSSGNLVAYLFATCAGVQYINSYVGDGTTGRTINCGFTGGARFVCIKATSTSGSWWTFDSARGIVTNSDPALQLNSTAAEVTSADAIDTASSGFIVNQEATCSLNASGVSYLVWAIA